MAVSKYIPLALIAGGFVALWRLNKSVQAALPAAPVNGLAPYPAPSVVSGFGSLPAARGVVAGFAGVRGSAGMGELGFGFKSVVKQVTQAVSAPVKVAVAPLRLAVAVPLAVGAGIKSGSFSAATDSLRKSAISPITSITKSTTAFQPKILQSINAKLMSAPGARIMFGRSKPITRSGQVATTAGSVVTDVQWSPVAGRSGWSTAPGEGGSTVFKGPAGQMFSAMPSDLQALGGIAGTIDYYLGIGSNTGTPIVDQSNLPQPSTETPDSAYYGAGPTGGSSSTAQSYTDPGIYAPTGSTASAPAPAPDPNPQVTQDYSAPMPDAAPADSQTVHPLIAVGVAAGAAALLFLGKKH